MSRIVSQLATRLEQLSSSLLDLIVVGPHRPVSQFRREPLVNGLYVIHAPHGAILLSGLMLETDSAAVQGTRADRIDALGSGGFATTYRVVDLGTADLARQLARIVFDLFGGAFPLSQEAPAVPGADVEKAAAATELAEGAPTFRKRGRPRKGEGGVAAVPQEAIVTTASAPSSQTEAPAPKKRGRPARVAPAPVVADIPAAEPAAIEPHNQEEPVGEETNGTRDTQAVAATMIVPDGDAGSTESPDDAANDADDDASVRNLGRPGEPQLMMTKNQRREKRRRELAQIRGGES